MLTTAALLALGAISAQPFSPLGANPFELPNDYGVAPARRSLLGWWMGYIDTSAVQRTALENPY